MIQALPKVSINEQCLANKMEGNIKRLADINFIFSGIVTDNHSKNISVFRNILKKYGNSNFFVLHSYNHS